MGTALLMAILLLQQPGAVQRDERPPALRYRINQDYYLPRSAETIMWASFTLDHANWPRRREVGISKTGLVMVLEWTSQTRARSTLLRMWPHEVREFFELLETRVRFCAIESRPSEKREPAYLGGEFGYALPSRAEGSCSVQDDAAVMVAPLMSVLRGLCKRAAAAWAEQQKGEGVMIETENASFLPQLLSVLHENQTLREIPMKKE